MRLSEEHEAFLERDGEQPFCMAVVLLGEARSIGLQRLDSRKLFALDQG
jgi:hypothetical protein